MGLNSQPSGTESVETSHIFWRVGALTRCENGPYTAGAFRRASS